MMADKKRNIPDDRSMV